MAELVDRVKKLYAIADELTQRTGRSFRPDGHMVGSIGEVLAAQLYGLTLLPQSTEGHDATKGTLPVQIKTTGGDRVALYAKPRHLLVLRLSDGNPEEVFNGPGYLVWDSASKPQKNGQRQISVAKLRRLMERVPNSARLGRLPGSDTGKGAS